MPAVSIRTLGSQGVSILKQTPAKIGRLAARNCKPASLLKKMQSIIEKTDLSVRSFFYNAKYALLFWRSNPFKKPLPETQISASQWKYSIEKNIQEYENQRVKPHKKKADTLVEKTSVKKEPVKEAVIEDEQINAFTLEIKKTLHSAVEILFKQPVVADAVTSFGDQFISLPQTISKCTDWLASQLGDDQVEPLLHAISQTTSKEQYQELKRDLYRLPHLLLNDINDEAKNRLRSSLQQTLYEKANSNTELKNHADDVLQWLFQTDLEDDFSSWLKKEGKIGSSAALQESQNELFDFTMEQLRKQMAKENIFNSFIRDSLVMPNLDSFVQIMMKRVADLFESLKTSESGLHFSDLVDKTVIIFFNHAEKINLSLKRANEITQNLDRYKNCDLQKLTPLEREGYESLKSQLQSYCDENSTAHSKENFSKRYMIEKYFDDESDQIHPLMKTLYRQNKKVEKPPVQGEAAASKLNLNWPEEIQKSSEQLANRLFHLLFPKPQTGEPNLFFLWEGLKIPKAFEKAEKVIKEMARLLLKDKKYNKIEASIENNFSIYRDLALEALQQLIVDQLSQMIHQVIILLSDRTFIEKIHHEVILPLINKLAITQMVNLAIREDPALIVGEIERYLSGENESKEILDATVVALHEKIKSPSKVNLNPEDVVLCIGDAIRTTMDRAKKEKEAKPSSLNNRAKLIEFLKSEQPPPTPQKGKAAAAADEIPSEYIQLVHKLVFEISKWSELSVLNWLKNFDATQQKINAEIVNLVNPYRSSHDKCFEEARYTIPLIATKARISAYFNNFFAEQSQQPTLNASEAENVQSTQRITRATNLSHTAELLDETVKRTFSASFPFWGLFTGVAVDQKSFAELLEDLTEKIWPPEPTMNVFLLIFENILCHFEHAKSSR